MEKDYGSINYETIFVINKKRQVLGPFKGYTRNNIAAIRKLVKTQMVD